MTTAEQKQTTRIPLTDEESKTILGEYVNEAILNNINIEEAYRLSESQIYSFIITIKENGSFSIWTQSQYMNIYYMSTGRIYITIYK